MQDNAASFDKLIPLMPDNFYYVCIDLPGHGLSSHFPPGLLLDWLNYVLSIHRVVEHFEWKKFVFLGHSIGGQLGTYYCSIYHELTEKLILIDAISPRKVKLEDTFQKVADILKNQIALEMKLSSSSQPVYTKEDIIKKLKNRLMQNDFTDEAAEILMKRAVKPREAGFVFTSDQRLKNKLYLVMTAEQQHRIISNINCQVLCLISQESFDLRWITDDNYIETYYFFTQHPKFHIEMIDANHDMQLLEPHKLNTLISSFML